MIENFEAKLQEYAELLVKIGMNVQKGQTVNIRSSVECAEFCRLCVAEAYKAGAKEVIVDWSDDVISRLTYLNADDEVFSTFPQWRIDKFNELKDKKACILSIYATDPEALAGVDSDRIATSSAVRGKALKDYYAAQMSNEFQWSIGSVPIDSWARKIFPDAESIDEAKEKLWDAIFTTVRVTGNGDAPRLWQEHIDKTAEMAEKLNNYNFKYLEYKNSLGTDLTIELPEEHIWMGGAENTKDGIPFVANMPTEEIFTAPKRDGINGVIYASMPLCLDGNIINNIKFTVKDGKIIDAEADSSVDVLKKAITMDEGASYFGEVALVPYDSPISNMNILFYNTLFDENASCHLAFGEAYPCIKGGDKMTREELNERGLNYSITHEDFMVGTSDLSIIGVQHDGNRVEVFKNGNFAI